MKKEKRRFTVLLMAVIVLGIVYLASGQEQKEGELKGTLLLETAGTADEKSSESEEQENADRIFVHVSGEVLVPGVYELPADARVFDALYAAGGLTENAAEEAVNQAVKVRDGDMVFIPAKGTEQVLGIQITDDRIDINRATAAELTGLPGIGEAKAEMIVQYREQHGAFSCPEDILNVTGIGNSIFEQIREKIKV